MLSKKAAVSCPILLLNYGGWDDTIAGLSAMEGYRDQTWLIDNASPKDRTSEVAAAFPEVRIIQMAENWGYAGAYNRAITIAAQEGYDVVYLLNNDAILRDGSLEYAVETLKAENDLAAVGSIMLHHHGRSVFFDGSWYFHGEGLPVEHAHKEVRVVRSLHGGGFALRLSAFRDIGPFCENYFLYHEETDWCYRAKLKGWSVAVDGRSRVDHEGGASSSGFNVSYYMARNRFLAMERGILLRDRLETRLSICEYEFLEAQKAELAQRVAITNGLIDGWLRKFGERKKTRSPFITVPIATIAPTLFRVRRKLRHLVALVFARVANS